MCRKEALETCRARCIEYRIHFKLKKIIVLVWDACDVTCAKEKQRV